MLFRLALSACLSFVFLCCSQSNESTPTPASTLKPAPTKTDARVPHPDSVALIEQTLAEFAKPHKSQWRMELVIEQRRQPLSQDYSGQLAFTSDDEFVLDGTYTSIMGGVEEPVVMQLTLSAGEGKLKMDSQVIDGLANSTTLELERARKMMINQGPLGNPMGNGTAPALGLKRLLSAFTWHTIQQKEGVVRMLGRPSDAVYEFFIKQRLTPSPASAWVELDTQTGWPNRLEMISSKDEVMLLAEWSKSP
ncbi:MAG: hypothetical protein HOM34_07425 [Planctomycetes bacterium]|jgi:hypothetical protein|nr:hypothetical protein [Planctomycetota bacterium]MBT4029152.1 hypothetical protein [Planctomycetota bacterium]MBT4559233.1 hypothetical protein [Planctomycetota bacterium]MBT5101648.1 hypothetical protein [Planctomycetota bacterium]MBT5120534.1 hypothetical protein [Planctomycetota bacterium]